MQRVRLQRVRRQGLEPRTRGLREGRLAAQSAPPAQTAQLDALKAQNAQAVGLETFHEPFHGDGVPRRRQLPLRSGGSATARP